MSRQWVLVRGLARDQRHWGEFKNILKQKDPSAEVICIDAPGFGDYNRLSSPTSIESIAEFIYSHFKEPKPKERYLIGISLGGMVTTELARLYPESIDGTILINTSFGNFSPIYHRLQLDGLTHLLKMMSSRSLEERELAVVNMISNSQNKSELVKEWVQYAEEKPIKPFNFFKQLFAAATYRAPYNKPDCPFWILTSEGDRMVNSSCSKTIAQRWSVPIEIHPSAGHELTYDDPHWVAEQCIQFVTLKKNLHKVESTRLH